LAGRFAGVNGDEPKASSRLRPSSESARALAHYKNASALQNPRSQQSIQEMALQRRNKAQNFIPLCVSASLRFKIFFVAALSRRSLRFTPVWICASSWWTRD